MSALEELARAILDGRVTVVSTSFENRDGDTVTTTEILVTRMTGGEA